jgi:hypothetical protein
MFRTGSKDGEGLGLEGGTHEEEERQGLLIWYAKDNK